MMSGDVEPLPPAFDVVPLLARFCLPSATEPVRSRFLRDDLSAEPSITTISLDDESVSDCLEREPDD